MGERKGTNLYYPPDYDPRKGSLNAWQGTHALRERANKLHLGILIIRFEMPYNIWCEGCGSHVGMGVRYNAEKKKVGMYYTTPVYQFKMKCHLCPNYFEIKTDPANLDYEIISGARRQERRWDPTQNGQVVPELKETSRKLSSDPMFKLEHGDKDKLSADDAKPRLKMLSHIQDRNKNDYLANRILRDHMRAKRNLIKSQKAADDYLRKKASLDIQLVAEDPEDRKQAALFKFNAISSPEELQRDKIDSIVNDSIFDKKSGTLNVASPSTSSTTTSSCSGGSSNNGKASTSKKRTSLELCNLVKKHNDEEKEARLSSSALKNIGVVLKRSKSDCDIGDAKKRKTFDVEGPVVKEEERTKQSMSAMQFLSGYGSSSSEDD